MPTDSFSEFEVVADDRSALERLGDNNPDSVDMETLRACFPKVFETFPDEPEWRILEALEAANMDDKKAVRNLKAKIKQAKQLGIDLQSAERNERRQFIDKRDSAMKREVDMMISQGEREEHTRLQRLTVGERSVELAKHEAPYLGVEREALLEVRRLSSTFACSVDEGLAVRRTADEDEADEDDADGADGAAGGGAPDVEMGAADSADAAGEAAGSSSSGASPAAAAAAGEAEAEAGGEDLALEMGQQGLPLRRLQDFALHDADGQLCRLDLLDSTKKSLAVYASGYVCSNTDGVDEQEAECAGASSGYYVANLGPFHAYVVGGYTEQDAGMFASASIFISTANAEYELGAPLEEYAPLLTPLLEKVELTKRVVRGLEAGSQRSLQELIEAVAAGGPSDGDDGAAAARLEFDEAYVRGHALFVLAQLRSYDVGAKPGELRTCGCAAIRELAASCDVQLMPLRQT